MSLCFVSFESLIFVVFWGVLMLVVVLFLLCVEFFLLCGFELMM